MVHSFRRYLVVVTQLKTAATDAKRVKVCIYDNSNKYVATRQQVERERAVLEEVE